MMPDERPRPEPVRLRAAARRGHHRGMSAEVDGRTIAFLVAGEGIERVELTEPWEAVTEDGHTALLVSTEAGEVELTDHGTPAGTQSVDRTSGEVTAADVDALVLPGGVANPDALRMDEQAVTLVREMVEAGKPVFAICHAPWVLAEADVVRGRKVTSFPSLRTDLVNAGAEWVDEPLVIDEGLYTSRRPDDLPAFCEALLGAVRGTD